MALYRTLLVASTYAMVEVAVAQTSPAPAEAADDQGLEIITVTAERRLGRLQDTPIAITALTEQALIDQQILQTQDIARAVPGLILNPVTANPSTFQIGLRGGSEQTSGLIVSEPVVGIYVDDVYRGRLQGSNLQLTDIERIEVLRGPQGTLYGRNTFSGALKIVTKTPGRNNDWLRAGVGVGSFDEVRADLSAGGPIAGDLGASLSLFYRNQMDGWIRSLPFNRRIGREENFAVRGKLAWDSGPLRVVGQVAYTLDTNDGYIPVNVRFVPDAGRRNFATRVFTDDAQPVFGGDPYVNASPTPSRGRTEVTAATLDIAYDLGPETTLRSITGYVATNDFFRWDITGGLNPAPGVFRSTFDRASPSRAEQWSQELQIAGQAFDDRLTYLAGLFFFQEDGRQTFTDTLGLFGLPTFPLFSQRTDTTSYAAFAQATYNLTPRTSFTVGLRYTLDEKRFDATIAPPANIAVSLDPSFDAFTPRFGVEHKFTDDVLGYVSVSKGFKAGGFNGLSRDPRVLALTYRPQTVWAYEGGLKADLFDRRLRTNLAVFYNDITDLQQTASRPDGTFPQENVGNAELWGIEAEVTARPTRGLDLNGAFSYYNQRYTRLIPTSDAALFGSVALPLVPDWTGRVGGTYEYGLGSRLKARLGGNAVYTGTFFPVVTNVLVVNGYWRVDGFVALATADGRWELNLAAQNLTDEVTYVSGIVTAPFPTALTPLRPRTWLLTLRYSR